MVRVVDGEARLERLPALVNTDASEGDALGLARKSRLMEILSGQALKVGSEERKTYPTPTTLDPQQAAQQGRAAPAGRVHGPGGKYHNDLSAGGVKQVAKLTQRAFEATVHPILMSTCAAGCHQPWAAPTAPRRPATSARTASCSRARQTVTSTSPSA